PSNDRRMLVWRDQQIVAKLDPSFVGIAVRVSTPAGDSATVPAEYYRYDSYNTAVGSAGGPYDAAVAPNGVVWISEQFSTDLKYWSPSDQAVHALTMPHGPGPGAFAMDLPVYGQVRTWSGACGGVLEVDHHNS